MNILTLLATVAASVFNAAFAPRPAVTSVVPASTIADTIVPGDLSTFGPAIQQLTYNFVYAELQKTPLPGAADKDIAAVAETLSGELAANALHTLSGYLKAAGLNIG